MNTPKFSIIIPTLNEEKFLPALLVSLASQTDRDFEVIVVDGNSKDKTVQQAKRFTSKVPNLKIITLDHAGVSCQRNVGAQAARSDWYVFVDADSVLLPGFIARIREYIQKKHARFFTTWFKADVDDPMYAISAFIMNISLELGVIVKKPWAPGPLTVIRRDAFLSVGGYNERITYGEDHELGVMVVKKGIPFEVLRDVLYIYSFRRFQKEGTLKVLERTIPSTIAVMLTNHGLKQIPGYVSGGSLYWNTARKKKQPLLSKDLEKRIKTFFRELME